MDTSEIKKECNICYEQIKVANERLKELRDICQHENTEQGLYSWRVGCINKCEICSDCGEVIKNMNFPDGYTITQTP